MKPRKTFVDAATRWLGYNEGDGSHKIIIDTYNTLSPLPRSYQVKYTDAWCATFVSAVAVKCGYTDIIPVECSCSQMITIAKTMGIWEERDNYTPTPGDLVLYDWQDTGTGDNVGNPDHVGIVASVVDSSFVVIEGNYSNAVKYRPMHKNSKYIRGYICPHFDVETVPATKTNADYVQTALDVIAGKYGTGANRVAKLTASGYDASKVQRIVNAVLS